MSQQDDDVTRAIAIAMFRELAQDEIQFWQLDPVTQSAFIAMARAARSVIVMPLDTQVSGHVPYGGDRYYSTDGGYPIEVQAWGDAGHVRIVPRWKHNGIGGPILSPQDAKAMGENLIALSDCSYVRRSWIKAMHKARSNFLALTAK